MLEDSASLICSDDKEMNQQKRKIFMPDFKSDMNKIYISLYYNFSQFGGKGYLRSMINTIMSRVTKDVECKVTL